MNCKVGWRGWGGCNATGACFVRRRCCPWCVTDYLCVCSRVCGYGCEGVRASVHPAGGRRGARVRVGGKAAISPSSELSAPTTCIWMEKMIEGRRRWAASFCNLSPKSHLGDWWPRSRRTRTSSHVSRGAGGPPLPHGGRGPGSAGTVAPSGGGPESTQAQSNLGAGLRIWSGEGAACRGPSTS